MPFDPRPAALAFIGCLVISAAAAGQGPLTGSPEMIEIPYFNSNPSFQVTEAGPGGTVRIEAPRADVPEMFAISEGYHVMVTHPEGGRGASALFRAQVAEVETPTRLILTVGPEAAARIHAGDRCYVRRPSHSTTAQLRSLPDVIPIGPKPPPDQSPAAVLARSVSHLRQIALAIHGFNTTMTRLPPAVIYGPDGKPWHSWRVLLLPYLGQIDLYNAYDFTQPWDGAKNIKLLNRMPDVYHDPAYGDTKGHDAHYAALVGAWEGTSGEVHTAFPPSGVRMKGVRPGLPFDEIRAAGATLRDATDGTSVTIAIAPASPDRKIPWTKPEDIAVGPGFPGLGHPGGIAAPHRAGGPPDGPRAAPVLLLDGDVKILLDTVKPETLLALASRDGLAAGAIGEQLDFKDIPTAPSPPRDPPRRPSGATLKIQVNGRNARAWVE
jgi:hypothetical protein